MSAVMKMSIDHNSRADSRVNGNKHKISCCCRYPAPAFAQGAKIYVVFNCRGNSGLFFEKIAQPHIVPAHQGGGRQYMSGPYVGYSGCAGGEFQNPTHWNAVFLAQALHSMRDGACHCARSLIAASREIETADDRAP